MAGSCCPYPRTTPFHLPRGVFRDLPGVRDHFLEMTTGAQSGIAVQAVSRADPSKDPRGRPPGHLQPCRLALRARRMRKAAERTGHGRVTARRREGAGPEARGRRTHPAPAGPAALGGAGQHRQLPSQTPPTAQPGLAHPARDLPPPSRPTGPLPPVTSGMGWGGSVPERCRTTITVCCQRLPREPQAAQGSAPGQGCSHPEPAPFRPRAGYLGLWNLRVSFRPMPWSFGKCAPGVCTERGHAGLCDALVTLDGAPRRSERAGPGVGRQSGSGSPHGLRTGRPALGTAVTRADPVPEPTDGGNRRGIRGKAPEEGPQSRIGGGSAEETRRQRGGTMGLTRSLGGAGPGFSW